MLEDALAYPTADERGLVRILVGGVLAAFGFLIVPMFLVLGYLLVVLERTSRGDEGTPPFEDWAVLFVDGIKVAVVSFVYALVPGGLALLLVGVIGVGASAGGRAGGILAGVGALGFVVVLVLALLVQYLLPAALTNMARADRLGAAFDVGTLRPVLVSNDYIVAVLLVFVVGIVGGIAFTIAGTITLGLGFLLAPFFYFWLYLVGTYLFGTAYGRAVGDV